MFAALATASACAGCSVAEELDALDLASAALASAALAAAAAAVPSPGLRSTWLALSSRTPSLSVSAPRALLRRDGRSPASADEYASSSAAEHDGSSAPSDGHGRL